MLSASTIWNSNTRDKPVSKENVVLALDAIVEPVSLSEPVYSDGGDTIYVMDQIGSNENEDSWLEEILLKQAINDLNSREKKILFLRFMRGKTQMEVAEEIGISQAQVSRLEKSAIYNIRNHSKLHFFLKHLMHRDVYRRV